MIKEKKDFKILKEIVENARIPLTQLAKKTLLSREVVQYRLKNLEKDLITGYQARINLNIFTDAVYTIYINIQKIEREAAIKKLEKLPLVHWISHSGGRYNYIVTFSVAEKETLREFIDKLFEEFGENLLRYTLTQHLREYKDTFASLFGIKELRISEKELGEKLKIDELDKKIIKELIKNSRTSNLKIAQRVHTTRETIRQRIKKLEKNEVILNYRTLIKTSALDLDNYVLAIKCKNSNSEVLSPLCNYFANIPGCSYICITAGEINLLITISVKNLKELDEISRRAQKEFASLIREIEPLPLFEIGSQNYRV